MKISFLIAAHNEEKIVGGAIEAILKSPLRDYEILIGLDGCTDGTEEIVKDYSKKNKNLQYYALNLRQGKPAVINALVKKAKGDILIINDADWRFTVAGKKEADKLLDVFQDEKYGGVAESFPVEWDKEIIARGNIGYKMVAYSTYYWMKFQKENYTAQDQGRLFITSPMMFMTNIFRRKLYRANSLLGDDFERTIEIMKEGYKIAVFDDPKMPRMVAGYSHIGVKDLFKQKIRTAKAREQLSEKGQGVPLSYYLKANWYILTQSTKDSAGRGLLMAFWIALTTIATVIAKFQKFDTREGWKLRVKR